MSGIGDLADRRGIPHFTFHGKGDKLRYLPTHPFAVAKVQNYLKAAGHGGDLDGPLFRPVRNRTSTEAGGAALTTDSLWCIVCRYAAAQRSESRWMAQCRIDRGQEANQQAASFAHVVFRRSLRDGITPLDKRAGEDFAQEFVIFDE